MYECFKYVWTCIAHFEPVLYSVLEPTPAEEVCP